MVERPKLDGTVLETRAARTLFDHDFERRHLAKHERATLSRRPGWEDLRRPLPVGPCGDEGTMRVHLDGATLTSTTKSGATLRRTLLCEPERGVVFAGAAKGVGAVVATVRRATSARVEAETGVVFSAAPTDPTSF